MNYSEPLLCNRYYHLFNHAVGSDNLFKEKENYLYFLRKFGQYISPVCKTYAYCLMPNHFHFLIKVREEERLLSFYHALKKNRKAEKEPDLSKITMQQFSNFFNAYAKAFNLRYNRRGALFIDYVRRKEVNDERYFSNLIRYIHYNPVHHGFCKNIDDWEFSSYGSILSDRKSALEKEKVLEWFGSKSDYRRFHETQPFAWKSNEIEILEFV
jgi:putative transposase